MKMLTILRHAKTKPPGNFAADAERTLTKRGRRDAVRVATLLVQQRTPVEWVLCSTAVRARQTVSAMRKVAPFEKQLAAGHVEWSEALYLASAKTLAATLLNVPASVEHVLLVAHNPGVSQLVSLLCAGSVERLALHLPTAGFAQLELDSFHWKQMRAGGGRLRQLIVPETLKAKRKASKLKAHAR